MTHTKPWYQKIKNESQKIIVIISLSKKNSIVLNIVKAKKNIVYKIDKSFFKAY